MKTKLHLINANIDIDLLNETNESFIKEQVTKDFAEFTKGTSDEYRVADKLYYLDKIRKRISPTENCFYESHQYLTVYQNLALIIKTVIDINEDTKNIVFNQYAETVGLKILIEGDENDIE